MLIPLPVGSLWNWSIGSRAADIGTPVRTSGAARPRMPHARVPKRPMRTSIARRGDHELRSVLQQANSTACARRAAIASSPISSARRELSRSATHHGETADARGHGLVLERLSRHGPAPGRARGHARGASTAAAPAPAARATSPAPTTITCCSSRSSPTSTARRRRCSSPPAMCRTGRRCRRSPRGCPDCVVLLRRRQPRLDDRGHPPFSRAERLIFAHNDPEDLDRKLSTIDRAPAEARRLRVRLFDGRRHRADRRDSATSPTSTAR